MKTIGLTLSGGGARAAYQVGALKAISDICKFEESPFKIVSGVSAGAINGVWLAAGSENFKQTTDQMWNEWAKLSVNNIYKTSALSLMGLGTKWIRDLSLGEWFGSSNITYLLDTSPLKNFLNSNVDFAKIEKHIQDGILLGLAVSATNYQLGNAVTFFQAHSEIKGWNQDSRLGRRAKLSADHVMASSAIPIFFPPVKIEGEDYGDGGVGLKSPLSPAIYLGTEKMITIGVQHPVVIDEKIKRRPHQTPVSLGDIIGTLLNTLFMGTMDQDISHLRHINETISTLSATQEKKVSKHLKEIPILDLHPSRDLGNMNSSQFNQFPYAIRHLLKGLGVTEKKGWDLLSYLAFDTVYTESLLKLGYEDTMLKKNQVLKFFED